LSKTGCAFAYDESIVIVRPYESEMTERPFATRKCTRPTPCTARGARALHERRRTAIARARVAQRRRHAARGRRADLWKERVMPSPAAVSAGELGRHRRRW